MSPDQQKDVAGKPVAQRSGKQGDPFGHAGSTPGLPVQFGLGKLMLALTVASAMLAPLAYLMRALRGQRSSQFTFILFCLAAPTLLLVLASLLYWLTGWLRRRPRDS